MEDDDVDVDDVAVASVLDASVDNTAFDDDNDGRVASTGPFGGRSFVMDGRDGGETSSVGSMTIVVEFSVSLSWWSSGTETKSRQVEAAATSSKKKLSNETTLRLLPRITRTLLAGLLVKVVIGETGSSQTTCVQNQ